MIKLNPFAISGLLIIFANIPLFLFVATKGKTSLTKIYSLHILAILLWGIGAFLIATTTNPYLVKTYWKFAYISVLFIPTFFYHAVEIMVGNKKSHILIYILATIFSVLTLLNKTFTSDLVLFFNQFYFFQHTTIYTLSFIFWELIVIIAHLNLIKFIHKKSKNEKIPILIFLFAGIGFLGGTINFLPGFGINIYPCGNFIIPIHSFAVTYAILRHQLLDIEIVYKKGLVYSTLFTIITLVYLLIVVSLEKLIQHFSGYNSPTISVITAFFIGVLFIPLRNMIQNLVDRTFFQTSNIEMINENFRLRQEVAQTEKLRTVATFASGMAHEIKNPLTAIKTFCEYLPKRLHDQEFINKFVPIVNREADRINELVHELLEYAKPSPLELKPTYIHKLINDTLELLNNQTVSKHIGIIREFNTENETEFHLDHKQIKQALLNIFLNAFEAMPQGGSLRITTLFKPSKLILKITDTGCGINKEDLPHIFDPFFTKKESGTGLGLSITHGIIVEHKGRIFAESEVGRGTTFRIELPIST